MDSLLCEDNNVMSIRPFQFKHAMDLIDGPSVSFGSLELLINDWKCGTVWNGRLIEFVWVWCHCIIY